MNNSKQKFLWQQVFGFPCKSKAARDWITFRMKIIPLRQDVRWKVNNKCFVSAGSYSLIHLSKARSSVVETNKSNAVITVKQRPSEFSFA